MTTMTDLTYHHDIGGASLAVCVKDYTLYAHEDPYAPLVAAIPDSIVETLYSIACEVFWQSVGELSAEYGYGHAYSEGRSGGWLIVEHEPDVEDDEARERWLKFASEVAAEMDSQRSEFLEALRGEHEQREAVRESGRGTN